MFVKNVYLRVTTNITFDSTNEWTIKKEEFNGCDGEAPRIVLREGNIIKLVIKVLMYH